MCEDGRQNPYMPATFAILALVIIVVSYDISTDSTFHSYSFIHIFIGTCPLYSGFSAPESLYVNNIKLNGLSWMVFRDLAGLVLTSVRRYPSP